MNRSVCWRLLTDGNDVAIDLGEFGTVLADFYSWRDLSRDQDVMWHEYTHAITWDVVPIHIETSVEEFDKAGGAFREAIADFFPLSFTNHSLYSPWQRQRELDPVAHPAAGVIEEIDYAWPYDRDCDPATGECLDEKHVNGRVWSNFLWDLRKRAELIETELDSSGITARTVEELQWEALFRMPRNVKNWRVPLQRLLDADEAESGSQLSYEIVASAARHGLTLTRGLSAVEPNHYVFERESGVSPSLTVYSGANDSCQLFFSNDPAFPEGSTVSVPCLQLLEGRCTRARIPNATDDENLVFHCTHLSDIILGLATDPTESTAIFYFVTTDGDGGPQTSIISGGGNTILHTDIPAFFIVPEGGGSGCLPVCGVAWGRPSLQGSFPLAALFVLAVFFRRRLERS